MLSLGSRFCYGFRGWSLRCRVCLGFRHWGLGVGSTGALVGFEQKGEWLEGVGLQARWLKIDHKQNFPFRGFISILMGGFHYDYC